jgi:hypothetical protein
MEFFVSEKSRLGFRHIHPFLAELVRALPALVEPEQLSDAAEQRFYPEPASAGDLDELRADWKAFVEPGLHEHFRSACDIVAVDLKTLTERKDDAFELTIPLQHADAWLNVLNQARLALAADLGFDEKLLASSEPPDLSDERGLALFRINLYAFMQQCLIEQLE